MEKTVMLNTQPPLPVQGPDSDESALMAMPGAHLACWLRLLNPSQRACVAADITKNGVPIFPLTAKQSAHVCDVTIRLARYAANGLTFEQRQAIIGGAEKQSVTTLVRKPSISTEETLRLAIMSIGTERALEILGEIEEAEFLSAA